MAAQGVGKADAAALAVARGEETAVGLTVKVVLEARDWAKAGTVVKAAVAVQAVAAMEVAVVQAVVAAVAAAAVAVVVVEMAVPGKEIVVPLGKGSAASKRACVEVSP